MDTQIAQVLEDAADFILVRGLHRGDLTDHEGRYCAIGSIYQVAPESDEDILACDATKALELHLRAQSVITRQTRMGEKSQVAEWSDSSADDFVVIDALRHCAKDIRNTAVA